MRLQSAALIFVAAFIGLCLIAFYTLSTVHQEQSPVPPVKAGKNQSAKSPSPSALVEKKNVTDTNNKPFSSESNRSSQNKEQRTVQQWLNFISRRDGISFVVEPSTLENNEKISGDFTHTPAGEAIPILLRGYDFFLQYGATEQGASMLQRVFVYPAREAEGFEPLSSVPMMAESQPASDNDSPSALRKALEQSPADVEEAISRALESEDESTRYIVLETALQEGIPLTSWQYETLLASDRSEYVRAKAFEAMALQAENDETYLATLIDLGLEDSSPMVRDLALALRDSLESYPDATPWIEPEEGEEAEY